MWQPTLTGAAYRLETFNIFTIGQNELLLHLLVFVLKSCDLDILYLYKVIYRTFVALWLTIYQSFTFSFFLSLFPFFFVYSFPWLTEGIFGKPNHLSLGFNLIFSLTHPSSEYPQKLSIPHSLRFSVALLVHHLADGQTNALIRLGLIVDQNFTSTEIQYLASLNIWKQWMWTIINEHRKSFMCCQ